MKSYTPGELGVRTPAWEHKWIPIAVRRTGEKKKLCPWKVRKEYESQAPEYQVPGPAQVRAPEPAPQTQSPILLEELRKK